MITRKKNKRISWKNRSEFSWDRVCIFTCVCVCVCVCVFCTHVRLEFAGAPQFYQPRQGQQIWHFDRCFWQELQKKLRVRFLRHCPSFFSGSLTWIKSLPRAVLRSQNAVGDADLIRRGINLSDISMTNHRHYLFLPPHCMQQRSCALETWRVWYWRLWAARGTHQWPLNEVSEHFVSNWKIRILHADMPEFLVQNLCALRGNLPKS